MIEFKLKANICNRRQLFRPFTDLLQILRSLAAFSFAVLCIIMFYCLQKRILFPSNLKVSRDEDVSLKSVDCICFLETRIYHGDILA